MEQNFVGYLIGVLIGNGAGSRRPPGRHPDEQAKLELLRGALSPLAADRDAFEPPKDLAVRAIGLVAEQIVATEGSVAEAGNGSVTEFLRTLGQKDPPHRQTPQQRGRRRPIPGTAAR